MTDPQYKVLLTDCPWQNADIERTILGESHASLIEAPSHEADTLSRLATDIDAIMTTWAVVPESVIAAASKLRIISRMGIGLDNIDVAAATRRRILVTNVPDYCLVEVAEHALALLLALGRKVAFFHAAAQAGKYQLQAGPPLRRIEGQTLGIVGFGHIGRVLARKAIGIGLKVLVTSRHRPANLHEGIRWVELNELLFSSDYVSLHLPLTNETRHLMNRERLAQMKPGSYLINTARGGLIDPAALAEALALGRLSGAALDVHEPEPPDLSQPPYTDPRVIVTPHAGFLSVESLENLRVRAATQVADCLQGRRPKNIVNPTVLLSSE